MPQFMPVGTRGVVKTLMPTEVAQLGAEMVLANTYHLMLRPGADRIARLGGIHGFAGWEVPVLTDSGGYQVFSLSPSFDDDGVVFRSVYDGSITRLTPEAAVRVQELIGSDVQMVLDVCPALPASREVVERATVLTIEWARRSRKVHSRSDQAIFGIVQGGTDMELRERCAGALVELDFDGYAIGGLSVGEKSTETLEVVRTVAEMLPAERPRYLMGVGDPVTLVEAVAAGIDLFDCVLPTRLGRHGTALTWRGRVNLRRAEHATSDAPIEEGCSCPACRSHGRALIRHLFSVGETLGPRLVTVHNLFWMFRLMDRIREAIQNGSLDELREQVITSWAGGHGSGCAGSAR